MQIWVDADACPAEIKEFLYRTAERRQVPVTLVANTPLRVPQSALIKSMCVPGGMNVVDRKIVELVEQVDLVVTADVPLAADVVRKGALALSPRGELYTANNVGERLAACDLMDSLRGSGMVTGGPANFNAKQKQAFANHLDVWLTKLSK